VDQPLCCLHFFGSVGFLVFQGRRWFLVGTLDVRRVIVVFFSNPCGPHYPVCFFWLCCCLTLFFCGAGLSPAVFVVGLGGPGCWLGWLPFAAVTLFFFDLPLRSLLDRFLFLQVPRGRVSWVGFPPPHFAPLGLLGVAGEVQLVRPFSGSSCSLPSAGVLLFVPPRPGVAFAFFISLTAAVRWWRILAP